MIMEFFQGRKYLVGALALTLLSGCDSGKKNNAAGPQTANVSGTALKGLVKNGMVTIYGVDENGVKDAALASGVTSSLDGTYSLQVTNYNGPVIVEVTGYEPMEPGFPSLMVCDIPDPDGCGNSVGFGDDYELGAGFELQSVVPALDSASVVANITPLTHMAAAYAQEQPGGLSRSSVQIANSQVANLFGLSIGNILSLPIVDVTKPAQVANFAANSTPQMREAALRASMISSAILSARLKDGAGIETASSSFANTFKTNNGQILQSQSGGGTTTTTLSEILSEMSTLVAGVKDSLTGIDGVDDLVSQFDTIATKVTSDIGKANTNPDAFTEAEPNEEELDGAFVKARALIKDIREIGMGSAFSNVRGPADAFANNLLAANELVDENVGNLMEAVVYAATAIHNAIEADAAVGTYNSANGFDNGINVIVAQAGGVKTYTVDVNGWNVNGQIIDDGEMVGTGVLQQMSDEDSLTADADISITGFMQDNGVARLEILEDSMITVSQLISSTTEEETETGTASTENHSVESMDLALSVRFENLAATPVIEFEGGLGLTIDGLTLSGESNESEYQCSDVEGVYTCAGSGSDSSTLDFETMSMSLRGEFTRGSESFTASLVVNAINSGYQMTDTSSWQSFFNGNPQETINESEQSTNDETADAFVRVNFLLSMDSMLEGVDDNVAVEISGSRNALRAASGSVELQYNGKILNANLATAAAGVTPAAVLTIANNQGAALILTQANSNDSVEQLTGIVTVDDVQQATVASESGVVLVRYTDGFIESF